MLPAPIWPLAQHAEFGQNCFDASIGSVCFSIVYSMPMNASFFKSSFSFHRLVGFYRIKLSLVSANVVLKLLRLSLDKNTRSIGVRHSRPPFSIRTNFRRSGHVGISP